MAKSQGQRHLHHHGGHRGQWSWTKFWNFVVYWPAKLKDTRGPLMFALTCGGLIYVILELILYLTVTAGPEGTLLPVTTNSTASPCYANPYCYINGKSVLLGPMDFYVHKPLSVLLNKKLHLDLYVTANFVSFAHIVVAILSIKLLAHESLIVRRLGVVVYEIRNLLDSMDGVVARATNARLAHAQLATATAEEMTATTTAPKDQEDKNFWGYAIDGICDGIGCIALMIACALYMQRHPHNRKVHSKVYTPLAAVVDNEGSSGMNPGSSGFSDDSIALIINDNQNQGHGDQVKLNCGPHRDDDPHDEKEKERKFLSQSAIQDMLAYYATKMISKLMASGRKTVRTLWAAICGGPGFPAFLYLIMLLLSSVFWNRTILAYTPFIENSAGAGATFVSISTRKVGSGEGLLDSPALWTVVFLWRFINPLNMTELLLIAIICDRMSEFLNAVKLVGFLLISVLGAFSEYYQDSLATNMWKVKEDLIVSGQLTN